jgi:hypothetical protein
MRLRLSGKVMDRYVKKGRTYIRTVIEIHAAEDGRLMLSYVDTNLLAYRPKQGDAQ